MNLAQVVLRAVLLGQQMWLADAATGGAQSATTAGGCSRLAHTRGARVGSGGLVPAASRDDGPSAARPVRCWGCSASC